jgi:thymidylate kinase
MFIIVDSIDGGGKSTIIDTWKETLTKQGNAVFDLKKYMQETGRYPELSELKGYDFIFSAEPTYIGVGAVIRQELIKNGTAYPVEAVAEAYSLDRLILYTKIHIPLLKDGKCIIQDRSISTSLAYQSLADPKFTMKKISALPGNKLALKYRPDYLILVKTSAEEAARRLNLRTGKKDDVIFENLPFLKKSAKQFSSTELKSIFTKRGTKVVGLNGNKKIDIMRQEANKLLSKILNKNIC